MKAVSEVDFFHYAPLNVREELRESTGKALYKYWSDACQRLGLNYKFDADGYLLDLDTLGSGYLIENVIWPGALPTGEYSEDNLVTLGELMRSRDSESNLFQFQVNPKLVEKILVDKDHGLLKGNRLFEPIEIVKLPHSEQFIIGGGRHRLVALLTMFKVIRNFEHLQVYVNVKYAKSNLEVASVVELSNTSRAMTRTEVSMLGSAARGENLTIFSSPEEFFTRARKMTHTSELKDLSRRLWVSLLQDTVVESATTSNAIGDLGYGFVNKLCRALNSQYDRNADRCILLVRETSEGAEQVFEALTRSVCDTLVNNWSAYLQEIREPVLDRVTREQKSDADGNPLFKLNISRNVNYIAQMLCDVIMSDVGESLGQLVKGQREKDAVEQAAKKESNRVAAINKSISTLEGMINQFETMDITVPTDMREQIEAKRAELREEIAKSSDVVPVDDNVTVDEELTSLLA